MRPSTRRFRTVAIGRRLPLIDLKGSGSRAHSRTGASLALCFLLGGGDSSDSSSGSRAASPLRGVAPWAPSHLLGLRPFRQVLISSVQIASFASAHVVKGLMPSARDPAVDPGPGHAHQIALRELGLLRRRRRCRLRRRRFRGDRRRDLAPPRLVTFSEARRFWRKLVRARSESSAELTITHFDIDNAPQLYLLDHVVTTGLGHAERVDVRAGLCEDTKKDMRSDDRSAIVDGQTHINYRTTGQHGSQWRREVRHDAGQRRERRVQLDAGLRVVVTLGS